MMSLLRRVFDVLNLWHIVAAVSSDSSEQSRATAADTAYPLVVPEYEELTPCLKEVTKIWELMINTPDRSVTKFDPQILTDAVRQGLFWDLLGQWWLRHFMVMFIAEKPR